jgi:hypothetical protein
MDRLEEDFESLSKPSADGEEQKRSNEEEFITYAFFNCIKKNRESKAKLNELTDQFA